MIDLVMEAPLRFSRMVRDALGVAMRRVPPAVFRARDHLAETLSVPDLVAVLDTIARRGSHGVLLKAPDVPAVSEAVGRLHARGIPVVTLVTDLRSVQRRAYVGLDNRCAGETAAYLMGQWIGDASVDVLVSSSGQRFEGEGERIDAFVHAMAASRPACKVHVLDAGKGLYGPTVSAVGRLLLKQAHVAAVYSVGGAKRGHPGGVRSCQEALPHVHCTRPGRREHVTAAVRQVVRGAAPRLASRSAHGVLALHAGTRCAAGHAGAGPLERRGDHALQSAGVAGALAGGSGGREHVGAASLFFPGRVTSW